MIAFDKSLNFVTNLFNRPIMFLSLHLKTTIILMGFLYLALSLSMSLRDYPIPYVHDEFAYLLGADTFSNGRITNPTHTHWEHFETFHVIHKPTYQSKYPPASSFFMAIGIIVTGHAIAGVWLSGFIAVIAICWMLTLYLPRKWAVFGGFIAALHPAITFLWSQNYWGGSTALLGGALVIGGTKKLLMEWKYTGALIMGIGTTILFHSRPFEGGLLILCFLVILIIKSYYNFGSLKNLFKNFKPIILYISICFIALISVGLYNMALTGNLFTFPHQLWTDTYSHGNADNPRIAEYTGSDPLTFIARFERIIAFYLGLWLALPFLLIEWPTERPILRHLLYILLFFIIIGYFFPQTNLMPFLLIGLVLIFQAMLMLQVTNDMWSLFLLGTISLITLISLIYTRAWPHYLAPVAPILFILISFAVMHISKYRVLGILPGKIIVPVVIIVLTVNAFTAVFIHPKEIPETWDYLSIYITPSWARERSDLIDYLESIPGDHLIIVYYPEDYNIHCEWVYNDANIDQARIVWTHNLGPENNMEIVSYYSERNIWLFNPDTNQILKYQE